MINTIKNYPFFKGLNNSELETVATCLREKKLKKGEVLFLEGNLCEKIFFVKNGKIKLFKTNQDGRQQVLEVLNTGDTCACNPGSSKWFCTSSAEAAEDSIIFLLSREKYVDLVQKNQQLAHALNKLFAERLQCFSNLIQEVSLKTSKERLVRYLLDAKDSKEDKLTREEIAQRIGVVRETVERQLQDLKKRKLIDIQSRRIIVLNQDGLVKLLQK